MEVDGGRWRQIGWDGRRRRGRRIFAVLKMTGNKVQDGRACNRVEAPPPDIAPGR